VRYSEPLKRTGVVSNDETCAATRCGPVNKPVWNVQTGCRFVTFALLI